MRSDILVLELLGLALIPFAASASLKPALPINHEFSLASHLLPKREANFHYASSIDNDTSRVHQLATTQFQFHAPVVPLDHTDALERLSCSIDPSNRQNNSMEIVIRTTEAFNVIKTSWKQEKGLYLVTYHTGCGLDDNQRAYHKVRSLRFVAWSRTVLVTYEDVKPTAAILEGRIVFGSSALSDMTRRGVVIAYEKRDLSLTLSKVGTRPPPSTLLLPSGHSRNFTRRSDADRKVNVGVGYGIDKDNDQKCPTTDAKTDLELDKKFKMVSLEDPSNEAILDTVPESSSLTARERRQERRHIARSMKAERGLSDWVRRKLQRAADAIRRGADKVDATIDRINKAFETVGGKINKAAATVERIGEQLTDGQLEFTPLDRKISFEFPETEQLEALGLSAPQQLPQFRDLSGFQVAQIGESGVYCVDCYAIGELAFSGTIAFNLVDGMTKAELLMNGNLEVGLHVGLDMRTETEHKLVKPLINAKFLSYGIPGIFDFGVGIKAQMDYRIKITTETQATVGAYLSWPLINAGIDLLGTQEDDSHLIDSGLAPTVERSLLVDQNTQMAIEAALPVRLDFGVQILDGLLEHQFSLVEEPRISALAGISFALDVVEDAETGLPDISALAGSEDCPNGVSVDMDFGNLVSIRGLPGGPKKLHEIDGVELFRGCVGTDTIEKAIAIVNGELSEGSSESRRRIRSPTSVQRRQTAAAPAAQNTGFVTLENRMDNTFVAANKEGQMILETHDRECLEPTKFLTLNGIVTSDSSDRLMLLYTNEIDEFGVSRLRVHSPSAVPEVAKAVMFTTSNNTANSIVGYVPSEGSRKPYFPIVCRMENAPSKFFIAPAPEVGKNGQFDFEKVFKTLTSKSNRKKLTGGKVIECSLKALYYGGQELDVQPTDQAEPSDSKSYENLPLVPGVDDVPFMDGPWVKDD